MKLKSQVKLIIYLFILVITFLLMIGGYIFKYNSPIVTPENTLKSAVGVVNGDCTISQKFEVKVDTINSIDITYVDFQKEYTNGTMLVEIFDDADEAIYRNIYNIKDLKEYHYMTFVFDPIKKAKDKVFELKITMNDMDIEKNFTFYAADTTSYEIEQIDNDNLELFGSIDVIQHGVSKSYYYMFVLFIIFLIEVFYGSYKYIKLKELSRKKLILCSAISILISCIMAVTLMKTSYNIVFLGKIGYFSFPLLLVTSSIEMLIIGSVVANYKDKVSHLFLALAIPLGALFCICMVPGSVPDEGFHAVMTYEIITGQLSQKDVTYIKELEIQHKSLESVVKALKENPQTKTKFVQNGGYWLFMYVTGALGMFIGKIFGLPVLGYMYCGCFINYIIFLLVGYLVIKKLPFGKYVALVYMLSPMYLQQATSLSCDVLINSAAMLYISYLLNIKFRKEKIKKTEMVLLLFLAGYLTLCKKAYFPMIILLFLVKDKIIEFFKKHKKFVIISFACITLFIVGSYILMHWSASSNIKENIIEVDKPQSDISKLKYTLANPFINIPYLILNTLNIYFNVHIFQFSGTSLNWYKVNGQAYFAIIFYILLFIGTLFDSGKYKFSRNDKKVIVSCFLINSCVIFAGLYLGWGAFNNLTVEGVQGRYFIPIVILLLLLLGTTKNRINVKNKNLLIAVPLLFINIYMLYYIVKFYL